MNPPWLFDPVALDGMTPALFRSQAAGHFGETAKWIAEHPEGDLSPPAAARELDDAWTEALAAEALLSNPDVRTRKPFDGLPETTRPCGPEGPAYGTLKHLRAAAALFPLATQSAEAPPRLARIWAIEDAAPERTVLSLDAAEALSDFAAKRNIRLLADLPPLRIQGASWQLAAALAVEALKDGVSDPTRLTLATDWIVTGAVDGDAVASVLIGNKLDTVREAGSRKWLYPSVDKHAFEKANEALRTQIKRFVPSACVSTVAAAFHTITGYGTRPEASVAWPEKIGTMHALVGGSIYANLAAVLFCPPKELHLWHSSNEMVSKGPARRLLTILERQLPALADHIHLHELPTHDLARAESVLEPLFSNVPKDEIVYFNITSSNRMMMMAADRFARNNPDIKLIYRDFDDPGLDYVQVWHEGAVPHTCALHPSLSPEREAFSRRLLLSGKEAAEAALVQLETQELP